MSFSQALLVEHIRLDDYLTVASTMLMWYEYIITLHYEITCFWGNRMSWTTILFFVDRYVVLLTVTFSMATSVSETIDFTFSKIADGELPALLAIFHGIVVEIIIGVRIYAMYDRSRKVLVFLVTLLCLCTAACIGTLYVVVRQSFGEVGVSGELVPALHRFAVTHRVHLLWTVIIPCLFYETTAFIMGVLKALQYLKLTKLLDANRLYSESSTATRMTIMIYRDSLLYLLGILVMYVAQAVAMSFPDPTLNGIMLVPTTVLATVIGNRVLFNLRYEAFTSHNDGCASPGGGTYETESSYLSTAASYPIAMGLTEIRRLGGSYGYEDFDRTRTIGNMDDSEGFVLPQARTWDVPSASV